MSVGADGDCAVLSCRENLRAACAPAFQNFFVGMPEDRVEADGDDGYRGLRGLDESVCGRGLTPFIGQIFAYYTVYV
jgi:hypothetical protein